MYISKDKIKEKFQHGGWSTRRILTWKRSSQRKDKILNSIQARAIKWSMDQLVRRFPSLETDRPLETGLRIRGTRKFNGLSAVRCPRGGSSKNTSRTERVPFARRNEKRASKVDDGGRKRRRRRRRGMKRKGSCQFPVEFTLRCLPVPRMKLDKTCLSRALESLQINSLSRQRSPLSNWVKLNKLEDKRWVMGMFPWTVKKKEKCKTVLKR